MNNPTADFLTVRVDRIWRRTRDCDVAPGTFLPRLSFISVGREFNLPISYDAIVEIGMGVRDIENSAEQVATVGVPFSLFAMEIAERSRVVRTRAEDKADLFDTIGGILKQIHPQAFFLSLPVRIDPNTLKLDHVLNQLAGSVPKTSDPNALLVMGRNPVRCYTVIAPLSAGENGKINGREPQVFDSLRGQNHGEKIFQKIYEQSRN